MAIVIIMPDGLPYDPAIHDAKPTPMEAPGSAPNPVPSATEEPTPAPDQSTALVVAAGAGVDPTPEPELMRLSPSIAKVLLARSPLHAWDEHRLGGGAERESSDTMDVGKVCEKLLLGTGP